MERSDEVPKGRTEGDVWTETMGTVEGAKEGEKEVCRPSGTKQTIIELESLARLMIAAQPDALGTVERRSVPRLRGVEHETAGSASLGRLARLMACRSMLHPSERASSQSSPVRSAARKTKTPDPYAPR